MTISSVFETAMLLCFGFAWPFSIRKSYVSRSNDGKSPWFLCIILLGYLSGIAYKLSGNCDYVLYFFIINASMVSTDIVLYYLIWLKQKSRSELLEKLTLFIDRLVSHTAKVPTLFTQFCFAFGKHVALIFLGIAALFSGRNLIRHHLGGEHLSEEYVQAVSYTILSMLALGISLAMPAMLSKLKKLSAAVGELKTKTISVGNNVTRIDEYLHEHNIADVQIFTDVDEFYHVLTQRVRDAKNTIDTINFIPDLPSKRESRKEYYAVLKDVIESNRGISVNRVVAITSAAIRNWVIQDQVEAFGEKNGKKNEAFSVACVRYDSAASIPILTIVVIDDEVFMGMYWGAAAHGKTMEHNIRMKNKNISKAFLVYCNSLWSTSKKLLIRGDIQHDNLEMVKGWKFPPDS